MPSPGFGNFFIDNVSKPSYAGGLITPVQGIYKAFLFLIISVRGLPVV